jgi:hypothetical protein
MRACAAAKSAIAVDFRGLRFQFRASQWVGDRRAWSGNARPQLSGGIVKAFGFARPEKMW